MTLKFSVYFTDESSLLPTLNRSNVSKMNKFFVTSGSRPQTSTTWVGWCEMNWLKLNSDALVVVVVVVAAVVAVEAEF